MKMWKLSHTYVCDCGEIQTMFHSYDSVLMPTIARGQTWLCKPVSTVQNTGMNLYNTISRTRC